MQDAAQLLEATPKAFSLAPRGFLKCMWKTASRTHSPARRSSGGDSRTVLGRSAGTVTKSLVALQQMMQEVSFDDLARCR